MQFAKILSVWAGGLSVVGDSRASSGASRGRCVEDNSGGLRPPALLTPFLLVLVVLGSSPPLSAEVSYTITDLGPGIYAYAINDAGQVAGDMNGIPFLWHDGVTTYLPPQKGGRAFDINNSTQIVGERWGGWIQAALWENGEMTTLGTFGGPVASACGINDQGQIVGWAELPGRENRAFVYSSGVMTDLGTFGGEQSWAFGINNAGQVVGRAETPITPPGDLPIRRAFLYDDGVMTPIAGDYSTAYDVNDLAQVVGVDENGGFLWDGGTLTTLSPFEEALAINNQSQVVGWSGGPGSSRAFLWEDGVAYDLNDLIQSDSAWDVLEEARDINDAGQIVGWGRLVEGGRRGFLLTPVPEPSTFLLLSAGGAGLSRRRR